jgi:hypothetical protein
MLMVSHTLIQASPYTIHKYSIGITTKRCLYMLETIPSNKSVYLSIKASKKKSYI